MDALQESRRLRSLDVFRGATIALMILVNNPGDWSKTYWPLLHAPWHGWTPTDLVFPFFLVIVGVAIPYAMGSDPHPPTPLSPPTGKGGRSQIRGAAPLGPRLEKAFVDRGSPLPDEEPKAPSSSFLGSSLPREPEGQRPSLLGSPPSSRPRGEGGRGGEGSGLAKIVRRSAILFALGMLGTFFPFYTVVLERVRIPGVLQRIAIVYLVAAFAYRFLRPRAWVALGVFLIACYWAAMMLIPVPGFGAGDLSPEGNLAFWLDHQLLGAHTWRFSPGPGDPEGLLSTLPAIVTALIGLLAGEHLRTRNVTPGDLGRVAGIGAALAFAGLAFSPLFPINKNLWSPTYTLLTGGLALIVFAFTYWQVDLRGRVGAIRPFEIFGRNSILAFVGSGLLAKLLIVVIKVGEGENRVSLQTWLYRRLFESWLPDYVSSLAWALAMVLVWLAILAALDRRKIYLKV